MGFAIGLAGTITAFGARMGVKGLLLALRDIQRDVHVCEYKGLCIGLDAYCFLHRGVEALITELLLGRPSTAHIEPLLKAVMLLRANGAEVLSVFDGGPLAAKASVELARQQARQAARWQALATLRGGGAAALRNITSLLIKAADITPDIAAWCFPVLKTMGVDFLVAPCEADAQLAQLALTGRVDVCATLDSDLLAFGCPRVLFNLDPRGHGTEIRLADLQNSCGLKPYRFTPWALVDLCVLSGCDYLPAIKGIGLKKASLLLHRSRGDVRRALEIARRDGFSVPPDYLHRFKAARLVFESQIVFDPSERRARPLRPLALNQQPLDDGKTYFIGPALADEAACDVAEGRRHPETLNPLEAVQDAEAAGLVTGSVADALLTGASKGAFPQFATASTGNVEVDATSPDHLEDLNPKQSKNSQQANRQKTWRSQLQQLFGSRLAEELASVITQNRVSLLASKPHVTVSSAKPPVLSSPLGRLYCPPGSCPAPGASSRHGFPGCQTDTTGNNCCAIPECDNVIISVSKSPPNLPRITSGDISSMPPLRLPENFSRPSVEASFARPFKVPRPAYSQDVSDVSSEVSYGPNLLARTMSYDSNDKERRGLAKEVSIMCRQLRELETNVHGVLISAQPHDIDRCVSSQDHRPAGSCSSSETLHANAILADGNASPVQIGTAYHHRREQAHKEEHDDEESEQRLLAETKEVEEEEEEEEREKQEEKTKLHLIVVERIEEEEQHNEEQRGHAGDEGNMDDDHQSDYHEGRDLEQKDEGDKDECPEKDAENENEEAAKIGERLSDEREVTSFAQHVHESSSQQLHQAQMDLLGSPIEARDAAELCYNVSDAGDGLHSGARGLDGDRVILSKRKGRIDENDTKDQPHQLKLNQFEEPSQEEQTDKTEAEEQDQACQQERQEPQQDEQCSSIWADWKRNVSGCNKARTSRNHDRKGKLGSKEDQPERGAASGTQPIFLDQGEQMRNATVWAEWQRNVVSTINSTPPAQVQTSKRNQHEVEGCNEQQPIGNYPAATEAHCVDSNDVADSIELIKAEITTANCNSDAR